MVGSIEAIENGAYRIRHLKLDAEVGDPSTPGFKPKLKLNRWGGECFIDLDFMPEGLEEEEIEEETDAEGNITKIKWKIKTADEEMEFEFYPVDSREEIVVVDGREHRFLQNELGGLEWKPVFKKKPKKLVWTFPVQIEGLRYAYQSPLHVDHPTWNERSVRPENVVGSYAVYHATKKNNEYKTGKAFHIYRPHLVDALGAESWADLNISNGVLTITLPQQFMDEAVYPVTVDPVFGEQVGGGTEWGIAFGANGERAGSAWTMPAPGGTANYIRAYINGPNACDCMVWINEKDSGGAGIHGQIATKENLACGAALHWEEFTLAGEVLVGGVDYILNIVGNEADINGEPYSVRYDEVGATAIASYSQMNFYVIPESPWSVDPDGTTLDYSIYCNYDEPVIAEGGGAGAVAEIGVKSLILDLLLEGVI